MEHKWTRRSTLLLTLALATANAAAQTNTFTSKQYQIFSDLDADATKDYAKRLDGMYEEYAKRLKDFSIPNDQKFQVHLFKKQSDYRRYTGSRLPNSAGIFIPSLQALAGFEESQGRTALRQTLQHEAFHQFAWQAISQNLPIWLDEGLAQVFEEGVWTGDKIMLGQVPPQRLKLLQQDMASGKLLPFKTLMGMSRTAFQSRMRDDGLGRSQYNQAWAMTHFLVFACDEKGNPRFRDRLIGWLRDLHAGRDPQQAFVSNFSSNIDGFEKRFREWVAALEPTPLAVYSDRVSKLAELIRLFKEDGREFDSVDTLRRHLQQGQFHLTEQRDGQTFTLDEDAMTYLCNLDGKPWPGQALFFGPKKGNQPLPDIVLQSPIGSTIRARFYVSGQRIDHDLVFETPMVAKPVKK
ncbi:MAG: hypothetical protein JWM57_4365 [Phycisphaerales bacterium]|nr:hypothetical protein [Phycisphaerales bacterium]